MDRNEEERTFSIYALLNDQSAVSHPNQQLAVFWAAQLRIVSQGLRIPVSSLSAEKGRSYSSQQTEFLLKALNDKSEKVREAAAYVLGVKRDSLAVQPLTEALNDKSEKVREAASSALEKIKRL